MITVKVIDEQHKADINLPNEPFELIGRMIPTLQDGEWSVREELFAPEEVTTECFPDENYDYEEMKKDYLFVGAYDGETCVGVGIFMHDMFKYLYLSDLKVNKAYRGQNIGGMLIDGAMELLVQGKYMGIYTVGQDNNLKACRFYLKQGFSIGGFNNKSYDGTSQQGKADIYFYKKKN